MHFIRENNNNPPAVKAKRRRMQKKTRDPPPLPPPPYALMFPPGYPPPGCFMQHGGQHWVSAGTCVPCTMEYHPMSPNSPFTMVYNGQNHKVPVPPHTPIEHTMPPPAPVEPAIDDSANEEDGSEDDIFSVRKWMVRLQTAGSEKKPAPTNPCTRKKNAHSQRMQRRPRPHLQHPHPTPCRQGRKKKEE